MRPAPLVLLACLLAIILAAPAAADEEPRPYGLQARASWTTSRIVGTPEPPPPYTVERAFPALTFKNPVYIAQEPGTGRFLVAELSGKIWAFDRSTPHNEARQLFLDIGRELYAFSFHPQYESNGVLFTFSPKDLDSKTRPEDELSRVSRYRARLEPPRQAEADSEEIIIQWPAGGHNGGEAIIGPDGFLYISTGDGSSGSDVKNTGQGVDDLFSVILRIDVEQPGADQPYSIPTDNPFVDFPGARPEVWAFGFRNPWRMSFDPRSGALWVGDVGQDLWEMIWLVQRGGNYGWSVQEGSHPFHPDKPVGPGPILPPVVEHHHTECRSITGGYMYYGQKYPELHGVYFYGDYEYGMIWGLRYDGRQVTWHQVLADTPLRIPSFGVSRQGDILMMDHVSGELYELVPAPAQESLPAFPRKLSETGLFACVAKHKTAAGVIPYSVNTPQWIDGATKQRFFALPDDRQIRFVARSADARTWEFPDGAVNFETISIETEPGNPASLRRLETRLLVKQQNHWQGYSYLWNEQQTDAELADASGQDLLLTIRDSDAPDGMRRQTWHVPSRSECMACHSRAAGFVLGLNTAQMNRDHHYGGVVDNQLRTLNHIGIFSNPLEKAPAEYDALVNAYDPQEDLDARARAYLHVNCSVCHVADGGGNSRLDLKYYQDFSQTGLGEAPLHSTFGLDHARIISPGDPFGSVLLFRLAKSGTGRMPYIGSLVHDEAGLDLIQSWISSLGPPAPVPEVELDRLPATVREAFVLARRLAQPGIAVQQRMHVAGQVLGHPDPRVRDLFERFLPEEQRLRRVGDAPDVEEILRLVGDAGRGEQLFLSGVAQCRNCHHLSQDNRPSLGPELALVARKQTPRELLESILEPSKKIEPAYATWLLALQDGQVLSGIVTERDQRQVMIKVLERGEPRERVVATAEIEQLVQSPESLMPERLIRDLTPQQAADLLAFLKSL